MALPCHRTDLDRAVALANLPETVGAIEVNDMVGNDEAHVEHGDERLASRQQLGIFVLAEEANHVIKGPRVVVRKRCRFHGCNTNLSSLRYD
jgi:hypothetical protein